MNVDTPVAGALRLLQILDERAGLTPEARSLLLRAETLLGEHLGLECTGVEDGWEGDDQHPFLWSHDGDTCPIHEWLVPSDSTDYQPENRSYIYRAIE